MKDEFPDEDREREIDAILTYLGECDMDHDLAEGDIDHEEEDRRALAEELNERPRSDQWQPNNPRGF